MVFIAVNLELRSPTASRKGDLVKFDLKHMRSSSIRPEIRALLPLRMCVRIVVIVL